MKFQKFSYLALAVLGIAFVVFVIALSPFFHFGGRWVVPLGFLAGIPIAFFVPEFLPKLNERAAILIIIALAAALGGTWLLVTRVTPDMEVARDFQRLFETAAAFAAGESPPDAEYLELFPHLAGLPAVLSVFFRIFGASVAVAQVFNLACFVASGVLIYSIGKKLGGSAAGFVSGILWAILPAHIYILSLVASEPLHILLTLVAIRTFLWANDADVPSAPLWLILLKWVLAGIAVAASSLIRPIGLIYIIAFALFAFVFTKSKRRTLILPLLAMAVAFFIITAPFSGGIGWNLYVGMNIDGGGAWNHSDFAVFAAKMYEGVPPDEIHSHFRAEGFARLADLISSGQIFPLLARKFAALWTQDSFTVYWLTQGALNTSPLDILRFSGGLTFIANAAYGLLLGFCLLSFIRQIKLRANAFLLPAIILMGVVTLFLIMEANPRYNYAGSAVLCLIAGGAASGFSGKEGSYE